MTANVQIVVMPSLDGNNTHAIAACDTPAGCACEYYCTRSSRCRTSSIFLGLYFVPGATFTCTPLGGAPRTVSGAFNGVGGVTVQDIFDYLSCWFATDRE